MILLGILLVYRSVIDLNNNLSPWPVPTTERGSLVDIGIYSYIRHPMYAGVLLGMIGLSLWTESFLRLLITVLHSLSSMPRVIMRKQNLSIHMDRRMKIT